jgi:hypothetical protein
MYDPWRCPECGAFYRSRPVKPTEPTIPLPTYTTQTVTARCTCPLDRVHDIRFGTCPVHDVTVTM